MREYGAIGFLGLLAGAAGYLIFGWVGVLGGLPAIGVLAAGHFAKQRWAGARAEGWGLFYWRCPQEQASAGERKARLEAILQKARRLAESSHDTYGARDCCLEIIRQTDNKDPLFMAAYDLYMSTVAVKPDGRPALVYRNTACKDHAYPQPPPPSDANVIPFPLSATRE
jgi:hypothetical protein